MSTQSLENFNEIILLGIILHTFKCHWTKSIVHCHWASSIQMNELKSWRKFNTDEFVLKKITKNSAKCHAIEVKRVTFLEDDSKENQLRSLMLTTTKNILATLLNVSKNISNVNNDKIECDNPIEVIRHYARYFAKCCRKWWNLVNDYAHVCTMTHTFTWSAFSSVRGTFLAHSRKFTHS